MNKHQLNISFLSKTILTSYSPFTAPWTLPTPIGLDPLPDVQLPLPLRAILARRFIASEDKEYIDEIINPPTLPDPKKHFPDLEKSVSRLCKACEKNELIAICGDYDADGMTSTALMLKTLITLGAKPISLIPNRVEEGYGLNVNMIKELCNKGIKLLITVDNGVAANKPLELAYENSIEVIITDHHEIPKNMSNYFALIHPSTTPINSPYRSLAGVGLAYVLASSLAKELNSIQAISIARDLFCVGTVADMAPLLGANRLWLREGLKVLHKTECIGLRALHTICGINHRPLSSEDIGFLVAPRINAVGRIGEPKLIIELLMEEDKHKALEIARECDQLNKQRKDLCDAIEIEAIALIESSYNYPDPFIFLVQNHWHQGVIGIVASRLSERYHRPTALLTGDNNGTFRSSVRAPKGFSVVQALRECEDLLEKYGGHPAAGGFTVKADNIVALNSKLNTISNQWNQMNPYTKCIKPESIIKFDEINDQLIEQLQSLEPFGIGNPYPVFWSRNCQVKEVNKLSDSHLKFILSQNNITLKAIGWGWRNYTETTDKVDIVYTVKKNYWNNTQNIQLELIAIRPFNKALTINRNGRRYVCREIDKKSISICNDAGNEIIARLTKSGSISGEDKLLEHSYVKRLASEASVGLGLVP